MARNIKFQRQSEAAEKGWELPDDQERTKSPYWSRKSVHRSPPRVELAPAHSSGSWKDRWASAEHEPEPEVPEKKESVKNTKKAEKESSASEAEASGRQEKKKKNRPVVINIH